jgi:uncharacterized membrane protein YjgN (DUF898 family)
MPEISKHDCALHSFSSSDAWVCSHAQLEGRARNRDTFGRTALAWLAYCGAVIDVWTDQALGRKISWLIRLRVHEWLERSTRIKAQASCSNLLAG